MNRKLKMILLLIASAVVVLVLTTAMFLRFSPQFGASKKEIRTAAVVESPNFLDGIFKNSEETVVMAEFKFSTLREYFRKGNKEPRGPVPVRKLAPDHFGTLEDSLTRITWFGHSAVLLEMAGKIIFLDPMLGQVPAPISWAGPQRFNPELPAKIDALPFIDIVLISHDHYDHLDYGSILKLKEKTGKFIVPLGVGGHLRSWGVDKNKITELDWWDQATFENLTFVSTPARHFSGRGLLDRNCTLWCSWVIQSGTENIFFSGDGGYGSHFREIGDRFGPFDFTMLECGQYNPQWKQIHMMPEELPQAQRDLRGKVFMPIHWGAFKLALHSWTDPLDRLTAIRSSEDMLMTTPEIGESIILGKDYPNRPWWHSVD